MAGVIRSAGPRFGISIDGVEIASFSELQGITTEVNVIEHAGRSLAPHELAHTVQRRTSGKTATLRLGKPASDRASLQKLINAKGRKVRTSAYDERGRAVAAVEGIMASGKTDVLQQEWSIVYESIQRVL